MVAGTFDIIHVGHIRFLEAAKKLAKDSELIVVVARNSTVRAIKGREPIFDEKERLEIVRALKPVDIALLGNEGKHIFEIIKEIRPDIVALGYDQNVSEDELLSWAHRNGLDLQVVRLPKFSSRIDSSSKVREYVKRKSKDEAKKEYQHSRSSS